MLVKLKITSLYQKIGPMQFHQEAKCTNRHSHWCIIELILQALRNNKLWNYYIDQYKKYRFFIVIDS